MQRLSELVKAANQTKLTKRSGIPLERLQAIASVVDPSLTELRHLASALRLTLDDLVPPSAKTQQTRLLFRGARGEHAALTERLSRKIGHSLDILRQPKGVSWLEA